MKEDLCIICILFCCFFSDLTWAKHLFLSNTIAVQIVGLPSVPLENIFRRLSGKYEDIKKNFSPIIIRKFYKEIPNEIREGIKPFGYFKSHIHSYLHRSRLNFWCSDFIVNPGPRMQFTHIKLQITGSGAYDPVFLHLYKNFPIKDSDFFDSEKYETAKNDLFNVAARLGFFKMRIIKSQILVDLKNYRSTVIIIFDTGPRFFFGSTYFSPTPFYTSFLYRFLRYQKGHYFSQDKVQLTRESLTNSDYFSTIVVTPESQQSKNSYIPIKIHLLTQPKKQYNLGIGFGTDTGPRILISTNFRWINSYGHRFNAYLRASPANSALVGNYVIPGRNPETDLYTFTASFLNQYQDTGKGRSSRLSTSYQTNLGNWQQIIALTALREWYNLRDFPETNAGVLYPSVSWEYQYADNALNPSCSRNIIAAVSGANKNILSKTSFLQIRLDIRSLFTMYKHTRFLIRASVGYTAIKNILNLPLSLQFFSGGAQSLRGFSYNSIGPGRSLVVSSFEIQQKIIKNIYFASFIDVGTVSNQLFNEKLKIGMGPGIIFLTPLGMFELTIANSISEPKKPWIIQFSIGQ